MSMSYRSGGRPGLGLLCAALVLAPMALAACGSIAVTGSSAGMTGSSPAADATGSSSAAARPVPARLALCADPAAADHVVIFRSATLRQIQPEHVLPRAQTILPPVQTAIANGPRVRALAEALCALPGMPTGPIHCPAQFFGSYQLRFTVAGRRLPAVTIQESGCELVTGLRPVRSVARAPSFWLVLAKAVGPLRPGLPFELPVGPPGSGCTPGSSTSLGNTHCPAHALPGGAARS